MTSTADSSPEEASGIRVTGISAECLHALSVVVPAHNEARTVASTVGGLATALEHADIDYEIVVVDDSSTDDTAAVVRAVAGENPRIRYHLSHNPRGFGYAVRAGLDVFEGEVVAIVMADGSDDPADSSATTVSSKRATTARSDRVRSRVGRLRLPEGEAGPEPHRQLRDPRALPQWLQRHDERVQGVPARGHRDRTTSAPNHFNLTVEIPLKAIVRGHTTR